MPAWGGRYAQRLTRLTLATYGDRCWLRWDWKCTGVATTADHVVPRSRGGTDDLENLRPACGHCNSARQDRPLTERPAAIAVVDGLGFFGTDAQEAPRQHFRFSPPSQQNAGDQDGPTEPDPLAFFRPKGPRS